MTDEQTGKDEQTFVPIESLLQLKSGYSKLRPSISVAKVTLQPPMSIHLSVCLLSKPSNSIKSIIPHHQTQQQHTHYHTQHHKNHQLYHHTHQHHHLLIFATFKLFSLFLCISGWLRPFPMSAKGFRENPKNQSKCLELTAWVGGRQSASVRHDCWTW